MIKHNSTWTISETKFDSTKIRYYETIFTLGNGYLGSRGVFEEDYRLRTPGTFVAGLFDQPKYQVTELPNIPDWTAVEITLAGERFDLTVGKILDYDRTLDLKRGVLTRKVRWQSPEGRITTIKFERFVSIKHNHLMGLSVQVKSENYSGEVKIISGLNGQVTNTGTQHFALIEQCTFGEKGIYLLLETLQSGHILGEAAEHTLIGNIKRDGFFNGSRRIDYYVIFDLKENETCQLNKFVSIYTSRDLEFINHDSSNMIETVKEQTQNCCLEAVKVSFDEHLRIQEQEWANRWERSDIIIKGDDFDQLAVRFAIFHLIQMTSWNDYRVSVAAKGLSGEGYRGHVFWDTEIFILPFFIYNYPEVARNLLLYRYHTLPGALKKAKDNGYEGAMYPWESADTGEETTPKWGGLDLKTKQPIRIWCGEIEQHITADIAYAIWYYYLITDDVDFMSNYGAEILALTARFWKSRLEYNQGEDYYEIKNVIGPDEYSEFVNNNYYTNKMVQLNLQRAAHVCELMKEWGKYEELHQKIGLTDEEITQWVEVSRKIKLTEREDGLLVQFDGFLDLKKIDVVYYRSLKGGLPSYISWEEVTGSQVLKQADVIMLLYLLREQYSKDIKKVNWDFYEPKTMHDSSLSAAIHSIVANEIGDDNAAYQYFAKATRIDLGDDMGNSDMGLHAATQGGIWQAVVNGFAGLREKDGVLVIDPVLPEKWTGLEIKIIFKGKLLKLEIEKEKVTLKVLSEQCKPLEVCVWGKNERLDSKEKTWVKEN